MAGKAMRRDGSRLALAGAAGCLLALVAAVLLPPSAWRAWLGSAFLWASIPVGALALLMIMRLTPGDWSEELGPFMEAQSLLLPLGAVLILPILAEAGRIYAWAHQAQPTAFRAAYLSLPGFLARAIVWWLALFALAARLVLRPGRAVPVACIGLVALPVLGSFVSTDWLLSLDPAFASSGFGLYVLDIQMLTAFALMLTALALSGRTILRPGILGGLLLVLLLLWSYFAFTHYVISWSDNLPPSAAWYARRGGPWALVLWVVAASRLIPTFLLFFERLRNSPRALLGVSLAIVAGSILEMAWLTLPAAAPAASATDIALFAFANLAMGALGAGAFLRAFAWQIERRTA